MKKLLCALLAAAMIFCTGCSSAAAAQNSKETASPRKESSAGKVGSYDLTEGETVDDSMTFRWARRLEDKTLSRKLQEEILPEYVAAWFEDGEILDSEIQDNISDSASGWILIAGKTKQEMGWNSLERQGKTAYCRRIQVTHVPHSQDYHLEKTLAAPDLRYPDSLVNPDILLHESIEETGLILPKIRSAELYVRSLGKVFTLKDPERLAVLQKATTLPPQVRKWTFRAGLPVDGVGNPLILDLEGQGKRVFLTDPQGGNSSDLWSGHLLLMPMSVYALFDVPLEARGFSQDAKGNTVFLCEGMKNYESGYDCWQYQFTLDPRGNLLHCLDLTQYDDPMLQDRRDEITYTYDEKDRMILQTWGSGEGQSRTEYAYDDQGRLAREESNWGEEHREAYTYEYDDQGRLTAKIFRDVSGKENTGGSVFFWYDEKGGKHVFWFAGNGEAQGDPPEAPLRRPAQ